MRSFHIIRSPLRQSLVARPAQIIKRHKFTGRSHAPKKPKPLPLPSTPARTRFAPSPTGYVHIGSLRTALYNYLFAKATGGQFVLRVEDTDQARTVADAESRLYEDLKWSGLSWDEGPDIGGPYGPYRQSDRLETYTKYAAQLIDEGHAYRCFCTAEQLDQMRTISMQEGNPTIYNRTCTHIPPDVSARRAANGEPHVVRFRCDYAPVIHDLVYKGYAKIGPEDDFIIIKQDGFPTYHFANVVDDYLMNITHVIRGAEWLVSTPRHVAIYDAFGWTPPLFAHVGLLVNEEKQKLSKRHGDVDIASWRDRGILPATLLNYVMLLGWSPGRGVRGQSEVMNLDEMVSKFYLRFTKGDITVNEKYRNLQKVHLRLLAQSGNPKSFTSVLLPAVEAHIRKYEAERQESLKAKDEATAADGDSFVQKLGPLVPLAQPRDGTDDDMVSRSYVERLLEIDVGQYTTAAEFVQRNKYLLWTIPAATYRAALRKETAGVTRLLVLSKIGTVPHSVYTISQLVAKLREALQKIGGDDGDGDNRWDQWAIKERPVTFLQSVQAVSERREGEGEEVTVRISDWGFHLARWVLAASEPGPSIPCAIEFLGKAETMRRMDVAYEIAAAAEAETAD
ncbi:hypothetical protein GGR53DRAFT_523315 [Hypoxylon sp. FL1150]|nr:hypothetical protein GGR53DRAFT_523315 [Hypoxylon sp. FL1150]